MARRRPGGLTAEAFNQQHETCLNCSRSLATCEAARDRAGRLAWLPCAFCGGFCNPCRPAGAAGVVDVVLENEDGTTRTVTAHRMCADARAAEGST